MGSGEVCSCATIMGRKVDAYGVLMGKPGGKGGLKYLSIDGRKLN